MEGCIGVERNEEGDGGDCGDEVERLEERVESSVKEVDGCFCEDVYEGSLGCWPLADVYM